MDYLHYGLYNLPRRPTIELGCIHASKQENADRFSILGNLVAHPFVFTFRIGAAFRLLPFVHATAPVTHKEAELGELALTEQAALDNALEYRLVHTHGRPTVVRITPADSELVSHAALGYHHLRPRREVAKVRSERPV